VSMAIAIIITARRIRMALTTLSMATQTLNDHCRLSTQRPFGRT
jgi:hypothetical protein